MAKHRIPRRRPRAIPAMIVTMIAIATLTTAAASTPAPSPVISAVDFGRIAGRTTPSALGVVCSTYGATPLSSAAQRDVERALDARAVRIPVGYRNGRVTSSAGGTGGTLDVPALVSLYRSWGYRVLAVIGGSTTDIDVHPGDPTKIMTALGFDGVDYSSPNEPDNNGLSVSSAVALAQMIAREGRALHPGFQLWGPVWSHDDRTKIGTFATAMGPLLQGVDYHHYAMGTTSISTAQALSQTPLYGQEVRELSADLAAKNLPVAVDVDELNFSWRYQDGTPGGDNRFFTAVNTVWMTSALGHVLQAGGKAMPYATQNGPLGVTVQTGQVNPDNRPVSSPMPAYWGIANWTGAGRWSHFRDTFYATTSSDPMVETFAVNNEARGYNLVIVNKDTTSPKRLALSLAGAGTGTYTVYRNDPAAPYAAPAAVANAPYSSGSDLGFTLPPLTVTVLVLRPGGSSASAPSQASAIRSSGGTNATMTWQPPVTTGGSPVTAYVVARDGTDDTGGGTYSTSVGPSTRSFTFTHLIPAAGYHLSVRAITAAGLGASWTSAMLSTAPSRTPTGLSAVTSGPGAVKINWSAPSPAAGVAFTGYRVSRNGQDSTGGGAYATTVSSTARSFTFTLLNSATTYRFSVQALDASAAGPSADVMFDVP